MRTRTHALAPALAHDRQIVKHHGARVVGRERDGRGRFVTARTNGHSAKDAKSTMNLPVGLSADLARILRPQAAYRWILPYIAAITPYYIESTLRGALAGNHVQQWELFDLMLDTWPELAACAQELTGGVMRKKLIYEPFHEEDEKPTDTAVEKMKLVSAALRKMQPDPAADENDLRGTIKDIIDGWFRGVTALEVDWQAIQDSSTGSNVTLVAPRATFWVHPVCFAFNQDGILGLRTGAAPAIGAPGVFPYTAFPTPQSGVQEFPPNKFLVGIHKAKSGSALGGAMLRPLAWWWLAANFSADWLLNLAQFFGLPFRWATYPPEATQATINAVCNMLQQMGSAGYAAFPEGTTMEFLETGAGRQAEYSPQGTLLDRADRYARLVLLGQTMTGGTMSTGKGGQAFGSVEMDVKEQRIESAGHYACGVINRQLIQSILLLNYGDTDEAPIIKLLEEEQADLPQAQRDQVLANIGVPIGTKFMLKKYDIPEPAEDEQLVRGTQGAAVSSPPGTNGEAPGGETPNAQQDQPDKELQSRLAKLSEIEDDAVFAKELEKLAEEIKAADLGDGHWVTLGGGRHVFIGFSNREDKTRFIPVGEKGYGKTRHILDTHKGDLVHETPEKVANFHDDESAAEAAKNLNSAHTERINGMKTRARAGA